jgi:oligosaccharyltransferase complex subunit epsilon
MAPKRISTNPSPSAIPPSSTKATTIVPSAAGQPTSSANKPASNASTNTASNTKPASKPSTGSKSGSVRNATDLQQIGAGVWNKYVDDTPQRVKLLDAFLVFLIAVGVLQFVYCVIAGNFVSTTYLEVVWFVGCWGGSRERWSGEIHFPHARRWIALLDMSEVEE